MLSRLLEQRVIQALEAMPVVAVLGPRQVGKTTLALHLAKQLTQKPSTYLDLELDTDLAKLREPELYLRGFSNHLLIIDEVQRKPDLFPLLRALVDIRKRAGERAGHFLLLGSASRDLLQQSSETLAGRIRYMELQTLGALEAGQDKKTNNPLQALWLRGGFPDSYLAATDKESWAWRSDFIATYVERDIPLLGAKLPPAQLRRVWAMLGHLHSQQLNLSTLASSLGVTHPTIRRYVDLLTELFMVRQLPPWSGNSRKRLVKSPKVYVRDSGLLHRLVQVPDDETLQGHPIVGASWEGFVIEQLLMTLSDSWTASYYRTSAQAEIDLVLEGPKRQVWAIEVKRTLTPTISQGFRFGCEDIRATRKFFVYPGADRYPLARDIEAIGMMDMIREVQER